MVALYSQGTVNQKCNDALTEGSFNTCESAQYACSLQLVADIASRLARIFRHSWRCTGVVGIVQSQ